MALSAHLRGSCAPWGEGRFTRRGILEPILPKGLRAVFLRDTYVWQGAGERTKGLLRTVRPVPPRCCDILVLA